MVGISIIVTFFAILQPVVSGGGNLSTGEKTPPNPKSLATKFTVKCSDNCRQNSINSKSNIPKVLKSFFI